MTAEDRRRAANAAATLTHLRNCKDRLPIAALLNEALALTGYDAVLLAEFLGERKLANLRKLQDQARAFDQSGTLGLADFIVQLSEFVVNQPREPLAATQPEQTDVVRLMTIHQAKGLEFPVVFVPDVGRINNQVDRNAVWDAELGPLVKLSARAGGKDTVSGLDLYRVISKAEDDAERIRLLYVATTRAADFLVLSAGTFPEELESPSAPWLKLLAERFDLQTGKCVVKLPAGFETPEVKVINSAPETESSTQSGRGRCDLDRAIDQVIAMAKATTGPIDAAFDRLAEPVPADLSQQRRFSVSRLNGELRLKPEVPSGTPELADDDLPYSSAAAADLGTLVHQALANVKFDGSSDVAAIVRRCADRSGGSAAEHVPSAEKLVADFLQSPRP